MVTAISVSIVIPAKNEEKSIVDCIRSIRDNEYPHNRYEIIVVDNGSTDSTVAFAESSGAVVYKKPGVNISALRNYGSKMANSPVLAFIDADCTVAKDWLLNASQYFQRDDIACFGSPPAIPTNSTWVQRTWFLVRDKQKEVQETHWLESMNMFVRKDKFERVGGFDESLTTCEDVDISYRLSEYGKIISDKRIKVIHHGEARTIKEFFHKERWRGKSNYKGVIRHGLKLNELPSIIFPFYFGLFALISISFLAIRMKSAYFYAALIIWQLPLMIMAFSKIKRDPSLGKYCSLLLLYNIYFIARLCAIF